MLISSSAANLTRSSAPLSSWKLSTTLRWKRDDSNHDTTGIFHNMVPWYKRHRSSTSPAATREESEVRKPLTPMLSAGLDRRHVLAGLGAGLIATPCAFAGPSPEPIGQRLAQAQQDGRVSGLHALLISQRGKLVFEHYGQGDDEAEGRAPLGTGGFGSGRAHDVR